jgi:MYXO-CTERM domain-containing protein
MGDGSRLPMPPIVVRQDTSEPASDKRPLFVGAGVVGLAAAFWWNRRRRERYAAEAAKDGDER